MKNFYKSNVLMAAVCALIAMLIFVDIIVFRYDVLMFWVSFPILLGVSALTIGKLMQIRQSEYWYFEQLTREIRNTDSMSLIGFPLPICVVDNDRLVIWSNDCFNKTFFAPNEGQTSIDEVTDMPLELFGSEGREIKYNDRWFRVYSSPHEFTIERRIIEKQKLRSAEKGDQIERITMLIFRENTDFKHLKAEYEMSRPIVMIAMVDNYEELLSGAKESDRASVTIEIDKKMEEYFADKHAVLKKLTSDKFLILLEDRYLREMINDKMSLINQMHDIIVHERQNVTMSIGVGTTASSLSQSERFAREMLDKALDRGGDQALVKTASGFDAFGAVSKGKERTGKVKIRLAAEEIKNLIVTSDTVYIMGHSFGDFDSAGASIGLTCAIRRMGKPAYTVARFRDGSKTNAKGLFDKFSEYDTPVAIEPNEAKQWISAKSALIIVDTHIIKRLEDPELYEMAQKDRVVIIDHHRLSAGAITEFAVRCQESNASSASELVTEIIQYLSSDIVLKPLEAEALLAGITLDTRDFVMRAGVSTFEAAAYLKKLGADTIAVKKLFDTSIESKSKRAAIISAATIYRGCCAIALVEENIQGVRVMCSQAADEMLYIRNVDASFTVYPIENGFSISARSLGKINVQVIMESMGNKIDDGGGHQTMAGAQLYNVTAQQVIQKLHNAIDDYFTSAGRTWGK